MPRYHLRSDLGVCLFDSCAIVLDIAADRYWRLGDDAGALLDRIAAAGWFDSAASDVAALVELGFVTDRPTANAFELAALPPAPEDSALETGCETRGGGAQAVEVWALSLWWRARIRVGLLREMLVTVARRKAGLADFGRHEQAVELAARFARWRRMVPLKPLCLPDSLALLMFLLRRGQPATLVFGVEAHPFSAHCWVQLGATVLNDARGHASLFRPILAL